MSDMERYNQGVKDGRATTLHDMTEYAYRMFEKAMHNVFIFLNDAASDITMGTIAQHGDGYESVARLCIITLLKQRGEEATEERIRTELKAFAAANRRRFDKYNPDFVMKPKASVWDLEPAE